MPAKGGEVTELIGHVRKAGFKVVKTGNQKHYKVLDGKGRPVVDANGPLIISSSPSDNRWREMHVKRLMGAKVLKADPWKPTAGAGTTRAKSQSDGESSQKKRTTFNDPDRKEEVQRAKVAAIHAISEIHREKTAVERARFEPVVVHLGGWSGRGARSLKEGEPIEARSGLVITELAAVAAHWATTRGREERPRDPVTRAEVDLGQYKSCFQAFKLGHTLGRKWLPFVTVFLDDLWRDANGDARKAASRYLDLLREQRGIVPAPVSPRALPPLRAVPTPSEAAPDPVEVDPGTVERVGPLYAPAAPRLAMRALWYMAKGSDDMDGSIDVASEIAELELAHPKSTHGKGK